jgi:hypothetical protein
MISYRASCCHVGALLFLVLTAANSIVCVAAISTSIKQLCDASSQPLPLVFCFCCTSHRHTNRYFPYQPLLLVTYCCHTPFCCCCRILLCVCLLHCRVMRPTRRSWAAAMASTRCLVTCCCHILQLLLCVLLHCRVTRPTRRSWAAATASTRCWCAWQASRAGSPQMPRSRSLWKTFLTASARACCCQQTGGGVGAGGGAVAGCTVTYLLCCVCVGGGLLAMLTSCLLLPADRCALERGTMTLLYAQFHILTLLRGCVRACGPGGRGVVTCLPCSAAASNQVEWGLGA